MNGVNEETRYIGSENSAWKLWRRRPQVVLMALIYFLVILLADMASAQYIPLLTPLSPDISNQLNEQARAAINKSRVRSKTVKAVTHMRLANAFFQQPLVGPPAGTPTFEFNLPGITPLLFVVKTARREADSRIAWTGFPTNAEWGTAILIVDPSKKSIIGEIRVGRLIYQIRPAGQGGHSIYTVDASLFPPDHRPGTKGVKPVSKVIDDGPQNSVPVRFPLVDRHGDYMRKDAVATLVSHGSGQMPIIDVMVLFTPEAASTTSNSILDDIDQARLNMATSFIQSGVHADVRVVSKRCTGSFESGDLNSELGKLKVDPQVNSWREDDHPDLVVLWVKNAGEFCGISFDYPINQIPIPPTRAAYAFSIVDAACATGNFSFAHELGHQMGLFHDRFNAGANDDSLYNYGFVDASPNPTWKTIMAEDLDQCPLDSDGIKHVCTRVNAWSNGGSRGVPIGTKPDPITHFGPADNVAALNLSVGIAANFKSTILTSPVIGSCPDTSAPGVPTNLTVQ